MLPPPIRKALRILERQRSLARRVLGTDPPGCVHHPQEGMMEENFRRAVEAIERAGAEWALVGAEAVNMYVEPRATQDFDLVISGNKFDAVLREIRKEFGAIQEVDIGAAIRLPELGIDLIRSTSHALFRIALERARPREDARVPPAEVLMALKFMSAISPWRKVGDRKQDAADVVKLYEAGGSSLDRDEMIRLAALVYPGAEREFTAMIDKLDRGEAISI
jgi:hypothetical protein